MKHIPLAVRAAAAVASAVLCLVVAASPAVSSGSSSHTPRTPIKHFVVVMQENHTFDNYFGTYPGANGIPPGARMPLDRASASAVYATPFHIGGSAATDLNHSIASADIAYHGGRMDGFSAAQQIGAPARQVMGYYNGSDLPLYWNMADQYVLFDRFFSSALGGSLINHYYWVAGGIGGAQGSTLSRPLDVPTIFDRLQQAGVSWKFYVQNYNPKVNFKTVPPTTVANSGSQTVWVPLLDIPRFVNNRRLFSHIVDLKQYFTDLHDGTLPQVAFIVPSGASEHPPGSIQAGQQYVGGLVNSLIASSSWSSSAFMLAYDDWGGWYDHVVPPRRDANGDGFRVPALLVSPYARRHFIDHTTLDFTSMLAFIEMNWNLRPLTRLDATSQSIMGAFDFRQAPRPAAFISMSRSEGAVGTTRVRDAALYSLYGAGALLAVGVVLVAGGVNRRRARWPGRSAD